MKNVFISDRYENQIKVEVDYDFIQTLLKVSMYFLAFVILLVCAFCAYIFAVSYR